MGPKTHRRDQTIDFLRGMSLLLMAVTHLPPTPIQRVSFQPFGFFTNAFAFVFLSGYVCSWRLASLVDTKGWTAARKNLAKRVVILMALHHAIATLIAGITHYLPATDEAQLVFGHYYPSALPAWGMEMIFLNQTVYLDILTLFILLLPLVLGCVWFFRRGWENFVLWGSFLLWMSVQFDVAPGFVDRLNRFTTLHVGSWQVLFVFGAWLGYRRYQGLEFAFLKDVGVRPVIFTVVLGCFVLRQGGWVPVGTPLASPYLTGFSIPDLGVFRLLNFAAVVIAFGMIPQSWRDALPRLSPTTTMIGRHSLSVFVCHFVLVYWVWYTCADIPPHQVTMVNWLGIPLLVLTMMVMFAWQLDARHRASRAATVAQLPPMVPVPALAVIPEATRLPEIPR
jgi:hypothetical protein